MLIGIVLQTSFLTPPFGFSLFYLRGVAPPSITKTLIYRGIIPFAIIQLVVLMLVWFWPRLATGLTNYLFRDVPLNQRGAPPPFNADTSETNGE